MLDPLGTFQFFATLTYSEAPDQICPRVTPFLILSWYLSFILP